jgi:NAD-dependent histone deacetylase SIR2
VRKLAEALGWLEELEELWAETGKRFGVEPAPARGSEASTERTVDEKLEDEVDKLTREVDEVLRLNKEHENKAREEVPTKIGREVTEGHDQTATAPLTVAAKARTLEEGDPSDGGGLSHVFPNIEKKSSL